MKIGHYSAQGAILHAQRLAAMLRPRRPKNPARVFVDQTVIEAQRRRMAEARIDASRRAGVANSQIEAVARERIAQRVTGAESDGELQDLAVQRADRMTRLDDVASIEDLNGVLSELDARPFVPDRKRPEAVQLAGMLKRAVCPDWWRRQLRRVAARRHEAHAIQAGRVGQQSQTYCTDFALRRRVRARAAALAMLEATELESEDGERVTLKACFDASVSNKAIRRGELMTRIRGCEEWAEERGHVGVFLTLTTPSRFHSVGGANEKYDGSTPADAQAWLCAQWAATRAALARAGVNVYGFRVAEPHRDGCTHWHALLWAESNAAASALCMLVRKYWLQWEGEERGARDVRCKAERILKSKGGALAYLAKYIAKNIDDAGAVGDEGHRDDDWQGAASAQGDLFNGTAARVDAWASTWGIRQFQAIGQPPVTVWRELRRVEAEAAADAPYSIHYAHGGAHRVGDDRACWRTFLLAQGGVCVGRDYRIRVALLRAEVEGKYEVIEKAKPLGVYEHGRPDAVVPSVRKEWRPRGAWGARGSASHPSKVGGGQGPAERAATVRRSPPWTRFNNCTRHAFGAVVAELLERCQSASLPPRKRAGGPVLKPPGASNAIPILAIGQGH